MGSYYYHLPKGFSPVSGLPYLAAGRRFVVLFFHWDYPDLVGSKWRLSSDPITITAVTVRWSTSFESAVIFLFLAITRFHSAGAVPLGTKTSTLLIPPLTIPNMQIDPLWLE